MTDIDFNDVNIDSDIQIMIGADNPILHIYTEIRIENKNELVALKTNLGWVIFGGRRNTNKYSDINAFSNKFDLGNIVSKFCRIE